MGRQKNVDMSIIPEDVSNKKEFEAKSQDLKEKDNKVKKVKKVDKVVKAKVAEKDNKKPVDKTQRLTKNKETKKIKVKKQVLTTSVKQIRKKVLHGKLYRKAKDLIRKDKLYTIDEALKILPQTANKKFTESIELHLKLEAPKKGEQSVRGVIKLPHSTGKTVRIAALTEKPDVAKKAGAKLAGTDDLIDKIKAGKIDFDILIAEPQMMAKIGPLAKILGPKGLMPNPKSGTITENIEVTVKELAGGKTEYKSDDTGNIHMLIGKVKDDPKNLKENIETLISAIGINQIKNITLCSTMGPGIKIDPSGLSADYK